MSSWYFSKNLKPQGPLSFEEMKKKILRGELGPQDLIMKEGEELWQAACEWRDFRLELFPAFQKNYFKSSAAAEKEWILLVFDAGTSHQEGPFSAEDIQGFLATGKVHPEDYVWRSGLTGWVRICDRQEFVKKITSPEL